MPEIHKENYSVHDLSPEDRAMIEWLRSASYDELKKVTGEADRQIFR